MSQMSAFKNPEGEAAYLAAYDAARKSWTVRRSFGPSWDGGCVEIVICSTRSALPRPETNRRGLRRNTRSKRRSSIFSRRIVSLMFMGGNSRCAHQPAVLQLNRRCDWEVMVTTKSWVSEMPVEALTTPRHR